MRSTSQKKPPILSDTISLPLAANLLPTPDPAHVFEGLAGLPHLLFIDSALRHPDLGRFSYVTADPFHWICERVSDCPDPMMGDPLASVEDLLAKYRLKHRADLPPFQGGAAGLF